VKTKDRKIRTSVTKTYLS